MDEIIDLFSAATTADQYKVFIVLSRTLLDAEDLPSTEREALNETIMAQGITDIDSLLEAVEMVATYFKEQ